MKIKKIIGLILVASFILSACNSKETVQTESSLEETTSAIEKIVFTESEPETSATETQEKSQKGSLRITGIHSITFAMP